MKTKAKTGFNFDKLDAHVAIDEYPEECITISEFMERYGVSRTTADYRMKKLAKTGEYEVITAMHPVHHRRIKCLVEKR